MLSDISVLVCWKFSSDGFVFYILTLPYSVDKFWWCVTLPTFMFKGNICYNCVGLSSLDIRILTGIAFLIANSQLCIVCINSFVLKSSSHILLLLCSYFSFATDMVVWTGEIWSAEKNLNYLSGTALNSLVFCGQ